jgi:hypothetical protein
MRKDPYKIYLFLSTLGKGLKQGIMKTICGSRTGGWSLPSVMSD